METHMFRSGFYLRWLNNAGFEIILPGGKHLFADPWLDEAQMYPVPLDSIDRMDYVLLSHTHHDHAASIGRIQKKFPQAAIFTGDLACDALCQEYDLNVERVFRMRGGECFEFDDVKIEAVSARHTESRTGNYYDRGYCILDDGRRSEAEWKGSVEMLNYRITAKDGSHIIIWGGMTTEEQVHRWKAYKGNDLAIMHVSPKQNYSMFARLVDSMGAKVVIPHHYDIWDTLFTAHPEMLKGMPLPPEEINAQKILGFIRKDLEEKCDTVGFFVPEHHKWYRFGFAMQEAEI